ncbi:MAG: hydroxyacid dehydrogenase, partial [Clostridia bacterium]|nr:hydroxyacid dehydrogenase [Clostridia bacterium]
MKAILFSDLSELIDAVYSEDVKKELSRLYGLDGKVFGSKDIKTTDFSEVRYIFSTWGMPAIKEEDVRRFFPSLKAIFYAAGTVKGFALPFLKNGVRVFSAWKANAVPVAEYATAQIILANKGFFQLARMAKSDYAAAADFACGYRGNYGAKVGIIGDGAIGSEVIKRLKEHKLDIYVYSITMTPEDAEKKGVKAASLEEIFSKCDVISNHLADNEQTKGIINKHLISLLKDYSTFINTGRGAQVDEDALAAKLRDNRTITAVLDVTYPEPPRSDSPLLPLTNVILTPHIAGSIGEERMRMAEYMLEESKRFVSGG